MSDEKTPTAADFVRSLGESIQANPVPAALIGMGVIWLFSGGRSSVATGLAAVGQGVSHLGSKGGEAAWGVGETVRDAAASVGQSVDGGRATMAKKVSDAAFSIGDTVPSLFPTARANIADLMQRQPLMLGAIGLGLGAAMAAALRPTELEKGVVGQASANLQTRAREIAAATTEQAAKLADGVTTAITNEAGAQGLTLEDLKQSARETGRKVKSVAVHAAGQTSSRGTAQPEKAAASEGRSPSGQFENRAR